MMIKDFPDKFDESVDEYEEVMPVKKKKTSYSG